MTSERIRRRIEQLLDEADQAMTRLDWTTVRDRASAVLAADPENIDAKAYLEMAARGLAGDPPAPPASEAPSTLSPAAAQPDSFASGRYVVRRFLGEGGKKKVYLAHDARLDRDVAFALIKTEGLDEAARERITREAQAMGRLGNHPNIVTVYDIGDEAGQPFLVLPVLEGGDVEGLIEKAPEHRLPLDEVVRIGVDTCEGLEFLHAKGLIHRDVKPGNTWLTNEGRAMIGDFGLAVAVDRSRLTQAGMMVGTVSYMAPEQAMGGEVTPRADLYALGAMLYEMVCGRPPFVGDESVAIIGQHLNTPPVAPSWHRPDCPPALEALILRLLEKDPGKRPSSATEVRDALRGVSLSLLPGGEGGRRPDEGETPQPSTGVASGGADPLYRTVFVGREAELKQLQSAFDAAMSGQGGLVMVVGEPGIGKTAVCQQLATYVSLRGGRTLVGHCYEEGSLSLPYLAFVEAMRTYVLARDPDGLRSDLGSGAADVARIVSEVRDRVSVELRDAGDPEDDRWRLLHSVTTFLRNAASVQPLVIVLEDLHWADRGTLDLLQHVARNLQGARLVVVGTYRDVEVDRAHPLSGTLAELRRSGTFLRVPLRGLTVDEVHRMYESLRGNQVSWAQAEAVHRQTEGNPLFIQEFLRYLVEEGYVLREGGRWVPAQGTVPGTGLPEGLRDVIGKRLSRLSDQCNRLLSIAAVIGRDFDLETLRVVGGFSEDELLSSIEDAVRVGVLEERSLPGAVRYRFAHAFFRQSLYEEMIAPRRLRLHQEVARALEAQYASRREEHAAELAEHYGQSTDRADLKKAVEYSQMAANRSMSVFAYAEAEEHLRRCLAVQEVLDPEDKAKRSDLLLALGDAILPQGNPGRLPEASGDEAFALAEELNDSGRAARAAVQVLECFYRMAGAVVTVSFGDWTKRANDHAKDGTPERVRADIGLALQAIFEVRLKDAGDYLRLALRRAQELGD
ncbi:MAG TPA: AAA family ATPase, partial [Dehalococcoidia bacterium]